MVLTDQMSCTDGLPYVARLRVGAAPTNALFADTTTFAAGVWALRMKPADVNEGGRVDPVTSHDWASSRFGVLLNDGSGAALSRHDTPTVSGPTSLTVGDVNDDGIPDAIAHAVDDRSSLALVDVNQDGRLDLVLRYYYWPVRRIGIRLGDGSGGFGPEYAVALDIPGLNFGWPPLVAEDLDGDGIVDIALLAQVDGFSNFYALVFFPGTITSGNCALGTPVGYPFAAENVGYSTPIREMIPDDLNGDGLIDFVVPTTLVSGEPIHDILHDGGSGVFYYLVLDMGHSVPATAALADLDGDGRLDIPPGHPGGIRLYRDRPEGLCAMLLRFGWVARRVRCPSVIGP